MEMENEAEGWPSRPGLLLPGPVQARHKLGLGTYGPWLLCQRVQGVAEGDEQKAQGANFTS